MELEPNSKIVNLFRFLKEYNNIKNPIITDINYQLWNRWMDDIPENKYIMNNIYKNMYSNGTIFSVDRPKRFKCPEMPQELNGWIHNGWDDFNKELIVYKERKEKKSIIDDNFKEVEREYTIRFDEDPKRVEIYKTWDEQRTEWREKELESEVAENLFNEFYYIYSRLKKEGELVELLFGDGILYSYERSTSKNKKDVNIKHPILLQSINIEFDADIPRFKLVESEKGPELYKNLFGYIEDYNSELVTEIYKEFEEKQYLPYELENSNKFFNRLIHALSPKGEFIEKLEDINKKNIDIKIYRRPVLFFRKRNLGFGVAIDSILDDLAVNKEIPEFLKDVIGVSTENNNISKKEEVSSSTSLEVNGIDNEILLTKPANSEQLLVAKQLQKNSAVLVQGPPGTGKTHTISNIIGHLLSQGKSILVTSYSEKALSVLKDKVNTTLQPLCLSLLSGVNSRREMEVTLDEVNANRARLDTATLKRKISILEKERIEHINKLKSLEIDLKNARINEYRPIVISGKEYKPSEAAKYINKNSKKLKLIPTPIVLGENLTLTDSEIKELYLSNNSISEYEEKEYDSDLPDIEELISPYEFKKIIEEKNSFDSKKLNLGIELWENNKEEKSIDILKKLIERINEVVNYIKLDDEWILESIESSKEIEDKAIWESLLDDIDKTYETYIKCNEFIIKYNPEFVNLDYKNEINDVFDEIISKLKSGGKINKLTLLLNKSIKNLIESCKINRKTPQTLDEFIGLQQFYNYNEQCNQLKLRWDRQVAQLGAKASAEFGERFIRQIRDYANLIRKNLNWYNEQWSVLLNDISKEGFNIEKIKNKDNDLSDRYSYLRYVKLELEDELIAYIEAEIFRIQYNKIKENKEKIDCVIEKKCRNSNSILLTKLMEAVLEENFIEYEECYNGIKEIKALESSINRRRNLLSRLKVVAPKWSEYIELRKGEYGENIPPDNIQESWLYTQFNEEINLRNKVSIDEIQNAIINYENILRENTSELAFNKAWLAMLEKLSNNKSQIRAIEGWRQLIKKIGAGTGKNAEKYKNEARKLMPQCQGAIPVWIMPLNKVVENFNPKENKFDVVIIDEASQADIMAIVALYLGKKVIIVGDNEQVSPLAIGEKIDEIERLNKEFLSSIPNNALYSGRFSIYDLAQASGYQPVRLKEHFRCVPEIIEFSNRLSYNGQIKALRDTSNIKTKPPIITYKVEGAISENKVNKKEAEIITSLILACCKMPEYDNKSFGVITLRGEKQASVIDKMLQERMEPKEYDIRKILCGNSSQFQGDERDIIFISMVDVNETEGPMRMMSNGTDDSNKKRYNVAVSRARDQLWVIHSMDTENDLKLGDMRREFLRYCQNYNTRQSEYEKNVVKAESEFEKRVMKYLIEKGYNITPQWEVGAYRIDMVASCKGERVAIECDGERWHGEEKLMEDMNRQFILERLGWRFIRIRGSEFFRDELSTIENVIEKLNNMDIYPEELDMKILENEDEMIGKIKAEALVIRENWENENGDLKN